MLTHLFKCRSSGLGQFPCEIDRARGRFSRGFSLVEITTVVAIMGIMAAIAVPRFMDSDRRYRVEAAAKRLTDDVKLIRQLSRAQGTTHVIEFTRWGYRIPTLNTTDRGRTGVYEVRLDSAPYNVIVSSLSATANQVKVSPFGDVVSTAELTMQVGKHAKKMRIGADGVISLNVVTPVISAEVELLGKGGVVGVELR